MRDIKKKNIYYILRSNEIDFQTKEIIFNEKVKFALTNNNSLLEVEQTIYDDIRFLQERKCPVSLKNYFIEMKYEN